MPTTPLTPEQERSLAQWREDWFNMGTRTGPVDRQRAETAITEMYKVIGHLAPRFHWTQSPAALLQAALQHSLEVEPFTRAVLQHKVAAFDHSEKALRDSIGGSIGATLWDTLQQSMGASLRSTLDEAVGKYVYAALWSPLEQWVESAIWRRLRDWLTARSHAIADQALRESGNDPVYGLTLAQRAALIVGASGRQSIIFMSDPNRPFPFRWTFGGQHHVNWIAFFTFCEQVLGVRYEQGCSSQLKLWAELCHAGWWAPYKDYCICAERPSAVRIDRGAPDAGARLHSEQGAALEFPDGTQVYAVHGVVR